MFLSSSMSIEDLAWFLGFRDKVHKFFGVWGQSISLEFGDQPSIWITISFFSFWGGGGEFGDEHNFWNAYVLEFEDKHVLS